VLTSDLRQDPRLAVSIATGGRRQSAEFKLACARMEAYEAEGVFPFGCFLDEQCAGVAALSRKLNPKYSHKVFFWGLYILREFRGQSIGRRLMEHRIAFARSLPGVRFVTLQVTTTNRQARALHQRFGFVSCGIEPQALQLNGKFYDFELMQLTL